MAEASGPVICQHPKPLSLGEVGTVSTSAAIRFPTVAFRGGSLRPSADLMTSVSRRRLLGSAGAPTRSQQSNTDQQMSLRNRWSPRTSSRIASGSWSRCHRPSSRPRCRPLLPARSMCSLEPTGGRTEFVRGDVCDGRGLAGRAPGVLCCPAQVSGRGVCMAGRRASLGHRHLATHPGAGLLDRVARSGFLRPEPTRTGQGRAPRTMPPTGQGAGNPNR